MPPQKTQTAPVITDGDHLAVLEGLVRHVIEELHTQNETLAKLTDLAEATHAGMMADRDIVSRHSLVLAKLAKLADEAAPLLESPVAKFMAQRRALKAAKAAPGG